MAPRQTPICNLPYDRLSEDPDSAEQMRADAVLVKQGPFCYSATMPRNPSVHQIILASESPRRRRLLKQAGLEFTVIPSSFDEDTVPVCSPETYVRILAQAKADDVSKRFPDSWVIAADTVVLIDGLILAKPSSPREARCMLLRLSGRTHRVYTGFTICQRNGARSHSQVVKTDVLFKDLTEDEIEWYVHTGESFDKAGGYAIQGLGTFLVSSITGSYTNVVGLPVSEVIGFLIKEGVLTLEAGKKGFAL